ncbi:MAG: adenine deaminase, partial [Bacteroidales bacterium]|nr:adenine deaminase [Bacteroidales bacterium]
VSEVLPLPVAGLMTLSEPQEVEQRHLALRAMARQLGSGLKAPFMTLAFMALPVIPDLKLTDKGLFDGASFSFTSVWEGSTN